MPGERALRVDGDPRYRLEYRCARCDRWQALLVHSGPGAATRTCDACGGVMARQAVTRIAREVGA